MTDILLVINIAGIAGILIIMLKLMTSFDTIWDKIGSINSDILKLEKMVEDSRGTTYTIDIRTPDGERGHDA